MKISRFYLYNAALIFLVVLLTFPDADAQAQIMNVTGTVRSADDNNPLVGVTIQVQNTNRGTASEKDGSFSVSASRGDTLIFSFIGFDSKSVAVAGSTLNVELSPSTSRLNDLVVVGYGTQKAATVTGAISAIQGKELLKTPSVTVSGSLAGKIQGITTRAADSRPGNGISLQIRGMGSPLYVIDGVPYGGAQAPDAFGLPIGSGEDIFNNLDPNDIESITILKDASAAIYGLRASNGVVLITTKKGGLNEKPTVNLSAYYGVQNFTRYPKPSDAYIYNRALVEAAVNTGNPSPFSPEELDNWKTGQGKYKSYDYFKEVMTANVPQYNVNVDVSGGTQKSKYHLGAGHIRQDGLIPDFYFKRSNVQGSISSEVVNNLTIGAQLSANFQKRHNVGVPGLDDYFNPFLSILSMWPTESPYANDNPNFVHQTHNVNVNPATYKEDITGWINDERNQVNVNLNAEYKLPFGLKLSSIYSRNYMNEDFDGFEYTYDAYEYDSATDTYFTEPGWGNQNPWREKHKRNVKYMYFQTRLNYDLTLNNIHNISAMVGYEISSNENTYVAIHGVPTNNYIQQMNFSNLDYLGDDWTAERRRGYIGRFNYDYNGKYLFEFLGRFDGSYLYAPAKRWGFFPGISAGWMISKEPFFNRISDNGVVNELKLRLSYGETGTELGVDPFGFLQGYNYNVGGSVFGGNYDIGMQDRGLPVTNLSWVTNKSYNIGIDFSLFDSKINGQFDVFERKRTGLPAARYDVVLPSEVGYLLPNENLNSDATLGLEGMITYQNSKNELHYSIGVNATLARFKSLHTYKPRFGNSWDEYRNSIEQRWLDIDWGYQVIGRFQSENDIAAYPVDVDGRGNTTLLPGDFIYKDVNGDGIINEMDERPIGYREGGQPYMNFGLNGSLSWKGISFVVGFDGGGMQSFLRDWELRYPFQNNGNSPKYMFDDRWHHEDIFDPGSAWISGDFPAIRPNDPSHSNYKKNTYWLTNVYYLRLKDMTVAYDFPFLNLKKIGVQFVQVYVNATNLFSIDNVHQYSIDPEIASTNGLVYPSQRLFTFGIKLTL